MIVKAWKNGKHRQIGTSYGLKVAIPDRNEFFRESWDYIILDLEGVAEPVQVNIEKNSFWSDNCHELIHERIREWLWANGLAPWKHWHPPEMTLTHIADNHFSLRKT